MLTFFYEVNFSVVSEFFDFSGFLVLLVLLLACAECVNIYVSKVSCFC